MYMYSAPEHNIHVTHNLRDFTKSSVGSMALGWYCRLLKQNSTCSTKKYVVHIQKTGLIETVVETILLSTYKKVLTHPHGKVNNYNFRLHDVRPIA